MGHRGYRSEYAIEKRIVLTMFNIYDHDLEELCVHQLPPPKNSKKLSGLKFFMNGEVLSNPQNTGSFQQTRYSYV